MSLGLDNNPIGALCCGHCCHDECYLDYMEYVSQDDSCTHPECPKCLAHIKSFTRLFLEPETMVETKEPAFSPGNDSPRMATHKNEQGSICIICYQPLVPADVRMGTLNCGHCFHVDCYRDYISHKGRHGEGNQIECPTCKTQITSFVPLILPFYTPEKSLRFCAVQLKDWKDWNVKLPK